MRFLKGLSHLISDPSRDLKERLFYLMTLLAMCILSIALIGDILYKESIVEIIILLITLCAAPLFTWLGVRLGKLDLFIRLLSGSIILVVIPIVFIFGGGVEGASIPWMVFCYLYVGLIVSGWWRMLALFTLTIVVVLLFMLGYYHPELIVQHTRKLFYLDLMLAVIEVGVVCYIMTWFQSRLYMRENSRSKDEMRKVEDLNRAQNRFFSNMSHEIRTPINSILGLNEIILRQEDASEEIVRDARNIEGAGKMLLALINDILDFSRIEAGKMDIIPVNYSFASMISDVVNMIWLRAEEKGLEFNVEVDPSIPSELFGDEIRIRQILINLLNNAVKYTKEGSVMLRVEREDVRDGQVLLSFSVIDTGMGIKQDALPYLFHAFRREDEEKNTRIEGTGLGLSIVKQLVDLMNGSITVNSVYTQGSTFMVTLRQKIGRADAVGDIDFSDRVVRGRADGYQAGFLAPDVRILIVDDNEMNLEVEKKLLAGTQIAVDTAISGEAALSRTLTVRYDMILMDHLMPEMNGIECMQHIRKQRDGLNNHTPIIVLTANADSENRELYSNSGFDDYLLKPVSGDQLEEMILSHLPASKVIRQEKTADRRLRVNTAGSYNRKIPVVVATNSSCELPLAVIRDLQIDTIPFSVHKEGKTYYDVIETGTDEILHYMRGGTELVPESPSVEEFELFFGQALRKAHHVIYIASSSTVSREYEHARTAARAYGNITIMDSGCASGALGLMVLLAHRMSLQGKSPEKIAEELEHFRNRLSCTFLTDASYLLRKKGILSRSGLNFIRLLNIRTIIRMDEGRYHVGRIVMGEHKRCDGKFVDYALPRFSVPDPDLLLVIYVDQTGEQLKQIEARIRRRCDIKNIVFLKGSGVFALQCGPDVLGLISIEGDAQSYHLSQLLVQDEEDEEEPKAETVPETRAQETPLQVEEKTDEPVMPAQAQQTGEWYEAIPGIDAEKGIRFSGSEEGYRAVLQIFHDSIGTKREEIERFYRDENWEDYTIKVHALKSSARVIGADPLADDAQALEKAGNERDIDFIRTHHADVMRAYSAFGEILAPLFVEEEREEETADTDPSVNERFDRFLIEEAFAGMLDAAERKDDASIVSTFRTLGDYRVSPEDGETIDELKKRFAKGDFAGMIGLLKGT
ncbi:MAG: DegV family EDD domain-containing protein [Lachnospiraceae bacterium]|nr:DegV family EDD domain-containing protein [Lachnospiraceae bacterium]